MTTWQDALKQYNTGKKYSIPKKGTPEYDAVKKIQNKLDKQNFKPHKMYESKTGKVVKADTKAEHEKLGKKGYTHTAPKKKGGMNNNGVEIMFAPLMMHDDTDTEDAVLPPSGPRRGAVNKSAVLGPVPNMQGANKVSGPKGGMMRPPKGPVRPSIQEEDNDDYRPLTTGPAKGSNKASDKPSGPKGAGSKKQPKKIKI